MRPDILNPLFAEVEVLKGIGPQLAKPLHRLGSTGSSTSSSTCRPSWIDRKRVEPLDEADVGRMITVALTARDYRQSGGQGARCAIFAEDEAAIMSRSPISTIRAGGRSSCRWARPRIVSGGSTATGRSCRWSIRTMCWRPAEAATIPEREPVYPLSEGLTNQRLAELAGQALARRPDLAEWIEPSLKAQQGWPDWAEALETAPTARGPAPPPARGRRASGSLMTRCSPTSSR